MDLSESFFDGVLGDGDLGQVAAAQELATMPTTQSERVGGMDAQAQKFPQQSFYPTPNSTNMHADQMEKSFMSPFPAFYSQNYPSVTTEGSFSDLEELLFTPMMSPAMTPMQQQGATFRPNEVDWDHFDQSLFAITGPAIGAAQGQPIAQPTRSNQTFEPATKKQRTGPGASKHSRLSNPSTPHMTALRKEGGHQRKRDSTSMAAPAIPDHKTPSNDSNEGVSPVDLNGFVLPAGPTKGVVTVARTPQTQPITPSMLMSLQNQSKTTPDLGGDVSALPLVPDTDETALPSAVSMPSPSQRPNGGVRSTVTTPTARDVRPRPVAPAHARSRSVNSSPALGPQRNKVSPELRPILPGGMSAQVGAMLASKSNYQHIVDGTYDQLNISYPHGMTQGLEVRRTSHKAAEQKRRDHLKECFEQLRTILPDRPEAGASKVAILKKGYAYILDMHATLAHKDAEIARLSGLAGEAGGAESDRPAGAKPVASPPTDAPQRPVRGESRDDEDDEDTGSDA